MIDDSTFVSVIAVGERYASATKSFEEQTWPLKELVFARTAAEGIEKATGLYCIIWECGYHFAPNTIALMARLAKPEVLVEIRDDHERLACSMFFRRAAHLTQSCGLDVERIEAGGVARFPSVREGSTIFYHSGNIGDIVYSLAFVKAMGGGEVVLGPEFDLLLTKTPAVRERMSERLAEMIRPLLMAQPYVKGVSFKCFAPKSDYNLNRFRLAKAANLVEAVFKAFNVCKDAYTTDEQPWLSVKDPILTKFPVIVNRTHRWRNWQFDWKRAVEKYQGRILFVGFEDEHRAFCEDFGEVPYRRTVDLYELARVIAGCSLFIGNQSAAYAIAEGLKVNTLQETSPEIPNCKFPRSNALYGERNFLYLPEVPRRQKSGQRFWQRIVSGFARDDEARALYETVDDLARNVDYLANVEKVGVPSILKQTPWECGFFEFPASEHVYYNSSFVSYVGERWLITRRALPILPNKEHSDTVVWRLDTKMRVHEMVKPALPQRYKNEQIEDARAVPWNGKLLISYCNWVMGRKYAGHQHIALLDKTWSYEDSWEPTYMNNRPMEQATLPEKNWLFFVHDGIVHFFYSFHPHIIVEMPQWKRIGIEHVTRERNGLWQHGEPRGGTPPVKVGDEYFSFFHGSLPWRIRNRRYYAGVYAFEAKPPFRITRMSSAPFLAGSELDPLRAHLPCCVFPAGAFFENGMWTITFGVNDCRSAWMRIPHEELLQLMRIL